MDHERIAQAIMDKRQRKFDQIAAEKDAKAEHCQEVRSWAKIADLAMYRQKVYEQRKEWVIQVVDAGIMTCEEAMKLARIKFKL